MNEYFDVNITLVSNHSPISTTTTATVMALVLVVVVMSDCYSSNSWDGVCVVMEIVIKVAQVVVVVLLPTSAASGSSFTLLLFHSHCDACCQSK